MDYTIIILKGATKELRTLEAIETELRDAREALSKVEGGTAEVYSRIVGYYRSVRNWNKGKKEEYGERKLYDVEHSMGARPAVENISRAETSPAATQDAALATTAAGAPTSEPARQGAADSGTDTKLLLFVRATCPQCPAAKNAAAKLGIPIQTVDAATESGLAEATRWTVMSTPTAILLSPDGKEITRAQDSVSISRLRNLLVQHAA